MEKKTMRLIDDKGRIFNFLNIFDLLVMALILLAVIPLGMAQYRLYLERRESAKPMSHVYRTVRAKTVLLSDIARRVKKGDLALGQNAYPLWEIRDIISDSPAAFEIGPDVPQKSDLKAAFFTEDNAAYFFGTSFTAIYLGETKDIYRKGVSLKDVRVIELSLKLLCKIERDKQITVIKDKMPLIVGCNIQLTTPDYTVRAVVTDMGDSVRP